MTKKHNRRPKVTLHLNYTRNYCTLYSTIGTNPINISHVVDSSSELFFLTPFEVHKGRIIIPKESTKYILDKILALLLSKNFTISVDPQIIDMQRELDKKMNNKSSIEILLGSKVSKGMPVPASTERKFNPSQRALFFYTDAKKYMYKTVEHAEFCDMSNYYGLYDTMTDNQRNWYFYWRSNIRYGKYLKTAITYINIYAYELINGVGIKDTYDGFNKLSELYIYYRNDFPLLDGYMGKWLIDYCIIHNLTGVHEVFNKIDFEWKTNDIDILLSTTENKLDLIGKFNVINFYSSYKITKSNYYISCKDKDAVKKKVEAAFTAVEQYFIDKYSVSICDKYSPYYSTRTVQAPFSGALYAGTKMIDIKYKGYNGNPDFKYFVAQIVRYTEKILRQQEKYRSPLHNVDLTDNIKSIIDGVLQKQHANQEQTQNPQQKIVVDMEKINNLIKDSDEMCRLLIETTTEEAIQPTIEVIIEKPQQKNTANPLEEFFSSLSDYQRKVMEILSSTQEITKINEIAAANNAIASQIFDDINELALETINDIIIDTANDVPEIIEQYSLECAQCLIK